MKINENLTRVNFSDYNSIARIKYIVMHYTANDGDTAYNNTNYFKNDYRGASAHYFVDENAVWRCVADKDISWHCGGGIQGSGGHSFHGICTNTNSIGIEMCSRKDNSVYSFKEGTIVNTVELVKYLMDKYNIPVEKVIRHYDVTGKICPAPLVSERAWSEFKNKLGDEIDMEVQEQINDLIQKLDDQYTIIGKMGQELEELRQGQRKLENPMIYNYIDENMPEWARPTIQKLVSKGKINGVNENGDLGLTDQDLRILTINDRTGIYGS